MSGTGDRPARDPYVGQTDDELMHAPTVFRDGLLRDQVVLVSGGGGGIGRAICYLFGRLGASVVACGRDEAKLGRLAANLERLGVPCLTRAMTIRDPAQVAALMDAAWERFGWLDVVINNAGGQEAGRRWIARGERGSIINMVMPHGIRINCIALGVFASPGLERYPPTARRSFAANPMRRLGDVHDVAEACVYLSAPSGRFITAEVLTVDGGSQAWGEFWPLGKPDHFKIED
jgi:citronellol/citronellal dehydrogenase